MVPSGQEQPAGDAGIELEAATDAAIAVCDGDARAAVRALIVATHFLEAEVRELSAEVDGITAAVSRGYARRRLGAPGEGAK